MSVTIIRYRDAARMLDLTSTRVSQLVQKMGCAHTENGNRRGFTPEQFAAFLDALKIRHRTFAKSYRKPTTIKAVLG